MSLQVQKMVTWMPVTDEALADAPVVRETLAVGFTAHPKGRYRGVWMQGYQAALEDIRAGRLVLVEGTFVIGLGPA